MPTLVPRLCNTEEQVTVGGEAACEAAWAPGALRLSAPRVIEALGGKWSGGHHWTLAPFLALTLQRPRDHHKEGGVGTTLLWLERGGRDLGKGSRNWVPPGEEASLGGRAPPSLAKMGWWECLTEEDVGR